MFYIFKVQRKLKKKVEVFIVNFFLSLVYENKSKYGELFSFTWYLIFFLPFFFIDDSPKKKKSRHPTLTPVGWVSQGRTEYCKDNNNSMMVKWLKSYLNYESLWSLLIELLIFSFENTGDRVVLKKLIVIRLKKYFHPRKCAGKHHSKCHRDWYTAWKFRVSGRLII